MHHLLASVRQHEGRGGWEPFILTRDAFWGLLLVAKASRQPPGWLCAQARERASVHPLLSAAVHTDDA